MEPTGIWDSTIASIDTLTNDTLWNVFEVAEPFEMGRVITPYGGYMANNTNGFNNDWNHTHVFDVTDYAPLLKGQKTVRAFYDGWSSGFSATVWFEFIEGTPPRDVIKVEHVYRGGCGYANSADFEANCLPAKNITLGADAQNSKLRVITSGHGFDNNVNCAEFCIRDYFIDINGTNQFNVEMWRGDCGWNPIFPQGGTWVLNRADWCPGERVGRHEHELTGLVSPGETFELDMSVENYNWSGTQSPYYIYDVALISYGAPNFSNDGEITDIIKPSTRDDYSRFNPVCGEPIVEVRNNGTQTITQALIEFGVEGGTPCQYEYNGWIDPTKTDKITLPVPSWDNWDAADPHFYAKILEINGVEDDYDLNNTYRVPLVLPPVFPSDAILQFKCNTACNSDNSFTVTNNSTGEKVINQFLGSLIDNFDINIPLNLPPGCYTLEVKDFANNGLAYWDNPDGVGFVRFKYANGATLQNFNSNFGRGLWFDFVIGGPDEIPSSGSCDISSTENIDNSYQMSLYPNPTKGILNLEYIGNDNIKLIELYNVMGEKIQEISEGNVSPKMELDLSAYTNGLYFIKIKTDKGLITKEVVLTK